MPETKQEFIIREIPEYNWSILERLQGRKRTKLFNSFASQLKKTFSKKEIEIWTFNSAAAGGGVADLLDAFCSLSKEKNINWRWFVIKGDENFFKSTKIFHNILHGKKDLKASNGILRNYLKGIEFNVKILKNFLLPLAEKGRYKIPDIILVHDPQPLALFPLFAKRNPVLFKKYFRDTIFIWQSHIPFNISENSKLGKFLIKYINFYHQAIFHKNNKYPRLKIPIFNQNINSINPLAYINTDLNTDQGREFIDATLVKHSIRRYGSKTKFIVQNARFDPWKDPLGVIQAFCEAFKVLKKDKEKIKLILTGPIAGDDIEEAWELLKQAKKAADKFNSENRGKFIYIKPLFTKKENLTSEQWEKFLTLFFSPDRLFPHLNRFQRRALKKMHIDPRNLTDFNIHDLEINVFQTFAYILIAKSLQEGQGLAAMGAKFTGKPLIASAVGGLTPQIKDHINGILVGVDPKTREPVTDFKRFRDLTISQTKDAIIELVHNPNLAKRLGVAARRDILENYTTPRQLMDYYQIFINVKKRLMRLNVSSNQKNILRKTVCV
jgi:trehalose synthase